MIVKQSMRRLHESLQLTPEMDDVKMLAKAAGGTPAEAAAAFGISNGNFDYENGVASRLYADDIYVKHYGAEASKIMHDAGNGNFTDSALFAMACVIAAYSIHGCNYDWDMAEVIKLIEQFIKKHAELSSRSLDVLESALSYVEEHSSNAEVASKPVSRSRKAPDEPSEYAQPAEELKYVPGTSNVWDAIRDYAPDLAEHIEDMCNKDPYTFTLLPDTDDDGGSVMQILFNCEHTGDWETDAEEIDTFTEEDLNDMDGITERLQADIDQMVDASMVNDDMDE